MKAVKVLLLALLATGPVQAAEIKLAKLHAVPVAADTVFDVLVKTEPQAPKAPVTANAWKIVPAETIRSSAQPGDRVIELYTGSSTAPILLARVHVRYQQMSAGWVPYFQLNEEPLVVRKDGRWQPVELARGVPAVLVQQNNAMPTVDGFLPTLEFGLAGTTLPIVSWLVR